MGKIPDIYTGHNAKPDSKKLAPLSPDVEQIKVILSAKIIGILEDRPLSVRQAQALTKVSAADFSRIRNFELGRFTIDRLVKILNKLEQRVAFNIQVQPG